MKCFVISPIGQPGSATREHADDVFECVIDPALKKADVNGRRADQVKDVGRITRQMYDDILTSDFCVAVLHDFNPNVFYELAVAHSAGIPVILLSEKGIDPPFDLKDERVFHYDLNPRAIHRGDNIIGLLARIESVRQLKGRREVPFGNNLIPLNATGAELPYVLRNESNATGDYWVQLVGRARERLYLAGIGFTGWRGIPGMREALRATADAGCEIRVLTMDAKNPAFGFMLNPDVTAAGAETQAPSIAETRSWFFSALQGRPKSDIRALEKGILFQQIIVSDDQALISPYLFSSNTGYSPRLDIKKSCPVFDAFLREFNELWNANSSIQQIIEQRRILAEDHARLE
jgi:hypothetical protein